MPFRDGLTKISVANRLFPVDLKLVQRILLSNGVCDDIYEPNLSQRTWEEIGGVKSLKSIFYYEILVFIICCIPLKFYLQVVFLINVTFKVVNCFQINAFFWLIIHIHFALASIPLTFIDRTQLNF